MRCLSLLWFTIGLLLEHSAGAPPSEAGMRHGWPSEAQEIRVTSTWDGTTQPAMAWSPDKPEPRPLLVGLHTWSGDFRQVLNGPAYLAWCREHDWHFVFPHFRGPNRTPLAMGSDAAVQDVVDAVNHLRKTRSVDPARIYLIGVSGGGHMAQLLAGRHPELWAGVSAWCGISDLSAWHGEHVKDGKADEYARDIEAALGGSPADSKERLEQARHRSPVRWLGAAREVPLDLNHGIHDGRTGSVPFRHSLYAFLAVQPGTLQPGEIKAYYQTQTLPAGWPVPEADPAYGTHAVKCRIVHGSTRITLFDGGHEILHRTALAWLAAQRKGAPPVWSVLPTSPAPAIPGN